MKVRKWSDKKLLEGAEPYFLKGEDNNKAVLLFHGWTSSPQEIRSTADHLHSLGYSVYAPLLIGHGTEPKDLTGITWEDWVKDAQSLFEDLSKEYEHILVGGMSMGANLALNVAVGNKVAGIVVMGTPLFFKLERVLRLWLIFTKNKDNFRKKRYTPRDHKVVQHKVHYWYYPQSSMYHAVRSGFLTRSLVSKVSAPILAVHTDTDHIASKKSLPFIMNKVQSKIKEELIVKDCYHVFTIDRCAEKVNREIGKFVSKVL